MRRRDASRRLSGDLDRLRAARRGLSAAGRSRAAGLATGQLLEHRQEGLQELREDLDDLLERVLRVVLGRVRAARASRVLRLRVVLRAAGASRVLRLLAGRRRVRRLAGLRTT